MKKIIVIASLLFSFAAHASFLCEPADQNRIGYSFRYKSPTLRKVNIILGNGELVSPVNGANDVFTCRVRGQHRTTIVCKKTHGPANSSQTVISLLPDTRGKFTVLTQTFQMNLSLPASERDKNKELVIQHAEFNLSCNI